MPEQIALVLHGGPLDGVRRVVDADSWPPPEDVGFPDAPAGHYHRTNYSQLPEPNEYIIRGGDYDWIDAGDIV